MQKYQKICLIIAYLVCMMFFAQIIFAQNNDALKSEIYSKLKCCACQVSFDKCSCPEAGEMKAYIDALLESGISEEEIFYKVAKKFSLNTILDVQTKQDIEKRLIIDAGTKRPQIILESNDFNFGKVSKRQGKINKFFKLYNKGNSDLIISNIRVSCSCVTVSLKVGIDKSPYFGISGAGPGWQAKIEPQKTAELEVVLDLEHSSMTIGRQVRDIFIASNDAVYPEATMRVEAEVID